ncbi:hypothetical protein EKH77_10245 [Streptomyces luteoverticillatus]|uniref:Uncharacterized protein n=1 Tax=Streptomyces luteoverticillatus TaxID=66425 RepID=A0A3Q9FYL7_STRLT|nr:hypothetical protein EKH77_10245 [Streptomyces luteoverticillatus]
MRGGHLGGGGGLAHRPQSSIDRRLSPVRSRSGAIGPGAANEKTPRTGGDAAPMPVRTAEGSAVTCRCLISAAR